MKPDKSLTANSKVLILEIGKASILGTCSDAISK